MTSCRPAGRQTLDLKPEAERLKEYLAIALSEEGCSLRCVGESLAGLAGSRVQGSGTRAGSGFRGRSEEAEGRGSGSGAWGVGLKEFRWLRLPHTKPSSSYHLIVFLFFSTELR